MWNRPRRWLFALLLAALAMQSCRPQGVSHTPTPLATPTALAAVTLPPVLVQVDPLPESLLPLDGEIRLIFSAPMQTESPIQVSGLPPGTWTWTDARTLVYRPQDFLPADTALTLTLESGFQAQNGLPLQTPLSLRFYTPPPLRLTEYLPNKESGAVAVDADIIAVFNQPVVPLGADAASLPAAFALTPSVPGEGRWLNTSAYIFHPRQGLLGGQTYQVRMNLGLRSAAGAPLADDSLPSWSFTTAAPDLAALSPAVDDRLDIEPSFHLTFNQPMDTESFASHFALQDEQGQPVDGDLTWSDDLTQFTFQPQTHLQRDTRYTLTLDADLKAQSGTPLGKNLRFDYLTWPAFTWQDTTTSFSIYDHSITLRFSAPLDENQDFEQLISLSPESNCELWLYDTQSLKLSCDDMQEDSDYTVKVASALRDAWGQTLGQDRFYQLRTPPAQALFQVPNRFYAPLVQVDPQAPAIKVRYAGLQAVRVETLALNELTAISWAMRGKTPFINGGHVSIVPLGTDDTRTHMAEIPLAAQNILPPGFYALSLTSNPAVDESWNSASNHKLLIFSSYLNTTLKVSAAGALVWAVDARSGAPVSGAPVSIYNGSNLLAQGVTDEQGLCQISWQPQDWRHNFYAVIGTPGEEHFGFASSNMTPNGMSIYGYLSYPRSHLYLYTDRPIYKPGQTVYYRAILRNTFDGTYDLPTINSVSVTLKNADDQIIGRQTPSVDDFGAVYGSFDLPEDARPGTYFLHIEDWGGQYITVAHYVKPLFALDFMDAPEEAVLGTVNALPLEARYYFGAPVNHMPLEWTLYQRILVRYHDGFRIGLSDENPFHNWPGYEDWVADGSGQTDAAGRFALPLDDVSDTPYIRQIHAIVQAEDESGQAISASQNLILYPSDTLIGVRSDFWLGQTGQPLHFEIRTWDTHFTPRAHVPLTATLERVSRQIKGYTVETTYTPLDSQTLTSDAQGQALLEWQLEEAGVYRLRLDGQGARSAQTFWVSGHSWPLDYGSPSLDLKANQESWQPGDTAEIFIPNPFDEPVQALITLERDTIHRQEIITLDAEGLLYQLPITEDDAPNIFFSVVLMGKSYQTAQGYLELQVEPVHEVLHLTLIDPPQRATAGDTLTLTLRVTDADGQPVRGAFSLALVDQAVLALKDDSAGDIVSAYYAPRSLGILSAISGSVLLDRFDNFSFYGGMGGGGGGASGLDIRPRSDFQDTAYWHPSILTDANGEAQVTLTLPDNLTTWEIETRGLTQDTRVGETSAELVVTRPLVVQPSVPRFFIQQDHAAITALVLNNTDSDLNEVSVTLQAMNFQLDDPANMTQSLSLPAHGRQLVTWWGRVGNEPVVGLLFSAQGGAYSDQVMPESGGIPVYGYVRPQSFVTAGTLPASGSRLEVISLPPDSSDEQGYLRVEASPSLAGDLLDMLDSIQPPGEQANLLALTYDWLMRQTITDALRRAGYADPLPKMASEQVLRRLQASQNEDGGWGWREGDESDARISLDLLTALVLSQRAGITPPEEMLKRADAWLDTHTDWPDVQTSTAELDFMAQKAWVDLYVGGVNSRFINALYARRDSLSPRGQAFLALTIAEHAPNDQSRALLDALQNQGQRSASGVFWAYQTSGWLWDESLFTTAVVTYALAEQDPAVTLLPDAIRYLVRTRADRRTWHNAWRDAWVALALTQAMQARGDLAADFTYTAQLNGSPVLQGHAGGPATWRGAESVIPISDLDQHNPNALSLTRSEGGGTLYYRAELEIFQPVESIQPVSHGLALERRYTSASCQEDCPLLSQAQVSGQDLVRVQLTLTVPQGTSFVQVEDAIPAGAQIVDATLKTQAGLPPAEDLTAQDWKAWYFSRPAIYEDHITWEAAYLPAGAYTLTYYLIPVNPGEYHVLPPRAWMTYFPDVQASGGGQIFTLTP